MVEIWVTQWNGESSSGSPDWRGLRSKFDINAEGIYLKVDLVDQVLIWKRHFIRGPAFKNKSILHHI